MNIFVGVKQGRIEFCDGVADPVPFAHDEGNSLVEFFRALFKGGWDGHMVTDSSMTWPEKYGWNQEEDPHHFLHHCIREASNPKAPGFRPRVETGPLEFEGDWPGVFIRGDNACHYGFLINQMIQDIEGNGKLGPIDVAQLRGLSRLLTLCDASEISSHPVLRSYGECLGKAAHVKQRGLCHDV